MQFEFRCYYCGQILVSTIGVGYCDRCLKKYTVYKDEDADAIVIVWEDNQ